MEAYVSEVSSDMRIAFSINFFIRPAQWCLVQVHRLAQSLVELKHAVTVFSFSLLQMHYILM